MHSSNCAFVLVLFILAVTWHLVPCKEYYIVPDSAQEYPTGSTNLTFSEFASEMMRYVEHNTTLYITKGTHYPNRNITVSNTAKFSMLPVNYKENPKIICNKNVNFNFDNVSNVLISGLRFEGCRHNSARFVDHFLVNQTFFDGSNTETNASPSSTLNTNCFNSNEMGGALILMHTELSVDKCMFEDNVANLGGAIFSESESSITISNSVFTSNCVRKNGGVLYSTGGDIRLDNVTFNDNEAGDDGGVAYISNNCSIKIKSCHFCNNRVSGSGGILYGESNIVVNISDSEINQNYAEENGGSLHIEKIGKVFIEASNFTDNSADYGGVLVARRESTVTINDSMFTSNNATTDGGTLYARTNSTLMISNSIFADNIASNDGTILVADESHIMIENSTFTNNSAGFTGGGVCLYDRSNLNMTNCDISFSSAGDSGGGVYGRKYSMIAITQCMFYNNSADTSGGAVHAQEDSGVIIQDSNFNNNTADYSGGIRVYIRSSVNISNSSFSENEGYLSGGTLGAYKSSTMTVEDSHFTHNKASFGSVAVAYTSNITIKSCEFLNNEAQLGGVFRVFQVQNAEFFDSKFLYNTATSGGVLYTQSINLTVENCLFEKNNATSDGGVMFIGGGTVTVTNSTFKQNNATGNGGAVYTSSGIISITNTSFNQNTASHDGGVFQANGKSNISFYHTNFSNNMAENTAGVVFLLGGSNTTINDCTFESNSAKDIGGVLRLLQSTASISNSRFDLSSTESSGGVVHMTNSTLLMEGSSFMNSNASDNGGVISAQSSSLVNIICNTFRYNKANNGHGGVLYLVQQKESLIMNSTFENNTAKEIGGALSLSLSTAIIIVQCTFINNYARLGAALGAEQSSSLYFNGNPNSTDTTITHYKVEICNNRALESGGGIYLSNCNIHFLQDVNVCHNRAKKHGGGIFAVNSHIWTGGTMDFNNNTAMNNGGGISLDNSTLYKINEENDSDSETSVINLTFNEAQYGGALYVNDEKCSSKHNEGMDGECFFQNVTELNFGNNYAKSSGNDLYGGLLDRCSVVSGTNSSQLQSEGVGRFKNISNIEAFDKESFSSKPVKVCICKDNKMDCSSRSSSINVTMGGLDFNEFNLSLVAVDQFNQPVRATIMSLSNDTEPVTSNRVFEQVKRCDKVIFRAPFQRTGLHELSIFADGPCDSHGISSIKVNVNVHECSCPPGFMQDTGTQACDCICDEKLLDLVKNLDCNFSEKAIAREGEYWLAYFEDTNSSTTYFKYSQCPYDYCKPPTSELFIKLIEFNANIMNTSDGQCNNERTGLLCGQCIDGYSLSLGSSKCMKCDDWEVKLAVILIAAFFAGIILVVVLLVFNITVAVGTINAIIFYANIIDANKSMYFRSHGELTPAKVFIAWLNLDIGIDTCFYKGMNTYQKTWLQLAFPAYIIFIVIVIISISSCSTKFSNLIGKRDPVATLATLILLSYSKLIQTSVTSFSYVNLDKFYCSYSNYSRIPGIDGTRWIADASIKFAQGKHIALLFVTVVVIILGVMYTALLFSWQWLLRSPNWKIFKWIKNQKLHAFLDTYHKPYTPKHRYWTGLLLQVRDVAHIISAIISIDPQSQLLSTAIIIFCVYLYKTLFMIKVYKNWLLNAVETFVYFNIVIFTIITLYVDGKLLQDINIKNFQIATAYISVGTMFILTLMVIIFHVYRYGNKRIYLRVQQTPLVKKLHSLFVSEKSERDIWSRSRNTFKFFHALDDDSRKGNTYKPPTPVQSTSSVVSMENSDDSEGLIPPEPASEPKKSIKLSKPRAKTHTPKSSSKKFKTQFFLSRKTEKSTSHTEGTKYLLLEEDEV